MSKTEKNLKKAFAGESQANRRYLAFAKKAADEGFEGIKAAEITLTHAMEVEKVHHKLYNEALTEKENYPSKTYYICKACGYTSDELPDKCPVCGAHKTAFNKF